MQLASQTRDSDQKVSPSIRAALIDSLFETPAPLLAGIVFGAMAAAMTALKTGEQVIWACVAFLILAGAVRAFDLQRYQARKSTLSADEAARCGRIATRSGPWSRPPRSASGASTTLLVSDDAVAHMISLSVTTGMVAGGASRAYGRQWIFQLQAALCFGPTVMALALRGTPYYIAMAFISAAYIMALVQLSANLHQTIHARRSWRASARRRLAGQFDTALNNMPHGLCMFAADGHLAVMNHRFSEMMNLSDDLVHRGASAADIVSACVSAGSISAASGKMILSEIENSKARDIVTTDPDAARDRSLSWTFQPMAGGGSRGTGGRHHRAAQCRGQDHPSGAI